MYKIGDFSKMSKVSIKTLRYYETKELLKPSYVDPESGYRYYDTSQLLEISKILSFKQIGLSIQDIKNILDGTDKKSIFSKRKQEIKEKINLLKMEMSKIDYLLTKNNIKNEIFVKEIPSYIIYYCEGVVENFHQISKFVLDSGVECAKNNPDLKCITPDYCYVSYLDEEYKENNIKIMYAQAVEKMGKETDKIKFMKSKAVTAICIYHKGPYENLRDSYNMVLKYIEDNDYKIIDNVRECYIDGCWNKDNIDDYLTEIQFPVTKK